MYRTENFGHTMGFSGFHFSRMNLLKELARDFKKSLDDVNRAMVEGKALDQLQDRLARHFRVNNITVRGMHRDSEELNVDVHVANKITAADKLIIDLEAAKVNSRYRSKLHVNIVHDTHQKGLI